MRAMLSTFVLILLSVLITNNVDTAIEKTTLKDYVISEAYQLDKKIEESMKNEYSYLEAIKLDNHIEESNELTKDELKKLTYEDAYKIGEDVVRKKLAIYKKKALKDEYRKLAIVIAKRHNIPPTMFVALIQTESGFNPRSRSHKNAKGLCQIIPSNYKRLGIKDPYDPIQNMNGGAKYFKYLSKKFKGNYSLILAAYNAGPGAVIEYKHNIPPYKETQEYVQKVVNKFKKYKKG